MRSPQRRDARHGRGFTLIELLVVVAIIMVMVGILLPALSAARSMARRAESASNMRQIGVAIRLYANENDGHFPEARHAAGSTSYIDTLAVNLSHSDEVRLDPSDPRDGEAIVKSGTSYPLNDYLAVPAHDPFGNLIEDAYFPNLHTLRYPADTYVAFIASEGMPVGLSGDHCHARSTWLKGWSAVTANIAPGRFGGDWNDPTDGSSNYLFADGHVTAVSGKRFKEKYEERAARGENIAKPPQ